MSWSVEGSSSNNNTQFPPPIHPVDPSRVKTEFGECSKTHITLKMKGAGHKNIEFTVRKDAPLRRIMRIYCDRMGLDDKVVRFTVDGTRVKAEHTPIQLDLSDGDVIDAWNEKTGG